MDEIDYILRNFKTIATVGFSRDPKKPSHYVPKFLLERGYKVIPVNPTVEEILGLKSYKSIKEVPERIELVQIFRPSSEVKGIFGEIRERVKEKGDVKAVWLQEGIRDDEVAEEARKLGLLFVQDRCMYKEYLKRYR